jgi:hypothetical protein
MYRFFAIFFCFVFSFFLSGCAAPVAMIWLMQDIQATADKGIEVESEEFEFEVDDPYIISVYVENAKGEEDYYIYASEYNSIRIILPEGVDANDLELTTSAGTIERTKEDSTLYRLFVKEPNLTLEITATDKKTGAQGFLITETIELSAPTLGFKDFSTGEISAEDIKKHGQLILFHDENNPSICLCKGFKLTRVPAVGNKISVNNKSEIFDPEVKSLLSKAAKGDIYIFDQIIISCNGNLADDKASTLVYIIK